MRIDKFLWCVRLYKSRSMAAEACDKEQVRIAGTTVKPARSVVTGEMISVRVPPIWRSYLVKGMPPSRVGAKLVSGFLEETTPFDELEKQEIARKVRSMQRGPGQGRPTKRDRRRIDRFTGGDGA